MQFHKILVLAAMIAACREPVCGNQLIEDEETCDDGNEFAGDGCHPTCQQELSRGYLLSAFDLPETNEESQQLS
jgi:cysteine-rich repeat protein